MERDVSTWEAAGYVGMTLDMLDRTTVIIGRATRLARAALSRTKNGRGEPVIRRDIRWPFDRRVAGDENLLLTLNGG